MAADPGTSRTGSGCYWPRAFLYLVWSRAPAPAAWRVLAELAPEPVRLGAREALLDITHSQRRYGPPEQIALLAERLAAGRDPVAVGLAATAVLARYAAGGAPGERTIAPWEGRARLAAAPIAVLGDPGPRLAGRLAAAGLTRCGDLARLPGSAVARLFGNAGRRLWLAAQGRDPASVEDDCLPAAELALQRILPPRTLSARTLESYLRHLAARLAARLHRHDLRAGAVEIRLRHVDPRPDIAGELVPARGEPSGAALAQQAAALFRRHWQGGAIARIDCVARGLSNASGQFELFAPAELAALQAPPDPLAVVLRPAPAAPRPAAPRRIAAPTGTAPPA